MTKQLTFTGKIISFGLPQHIGPYNGDPGWNLTIDGSDHGSNNGEGMDIKVDLHGYSMCPVNVCNEDARIKVTIEVITPETRLRPWRAEEVPMPILIRPKNQTIVRYLVTKVSERGVQCCDSLFLYDTLAGYYDHSIDGGKTWKPAGVEEVIS